MDYPKISIVTPNYNGATYLEETIKSIVNQNYPNLEYIIIDGDSTDGSIEIIKKYETHLKYWVSERDKGLYFALIKGFEKTTGEIMGWLNSDDVHHPNSLFHLAKIFQNEKNNWVQGIPNTINSEGKRTYERQHYSDKFLYLLKAHRYSSKYFVQQESTFWRRRVWSRVGCQLSNQFRVAGDFDLWMKFFRHEKLHSIDKYLASFRVREGQLSSEKFDLYLEETDFIIANELQSLSKTERFTFLILKQIKNYYRNKIRFYDSSLYFNHSRTI